MYTRQQFIDLFRQGSSEAAFTEADVLEIFNDLDELIAIINEYEMSPVRMWNTEEDHAIMPYAIHLSKAIYADEQSEPFLISKRNTSLSRVWVYSIQIPGNLKRTLILEVVEGRSAPSLFIL
jgi:hypothetical protein